MKLWIALISACLSCMATAGAGTESVASTPKATARDFARLPTYEKVSLSPDGLYLGFTAHVGGKSLLGTLRLADMKPMAALHFDGGGTIADFYWVSASRLVAELGTKEEGYLAQPLRTGSLYGMGGDGSNKAALYTSVVDIPFLRVDASGSVTKGLTPTGWAFMESPLVDDPESALVRIHQPHNRHSLPEYPSLYRMNTRTGATRKMASAPMRDPYHFFSDAQGNPRLVWGSQDKADETLSYYRDGDDWKPVPLTGAVVTPRLVSNDGRLAYFEVESADGGECLVEWDITRPQNSGRQLLCRPDALMGSVLADAKGIPYAVRIGEDGEIAVLDEKQVEIRVQQSLQQQFPDASVSLESTSRDHQVLLYRVRSDRDPGQLYVFEGASGEARWLASIQSGIDPSRMAEQRRIHFKARDGLTIEGLVTLPPGKEVENLPLIVMPHGGPIGVWDSWGWDADAQFLASRGYAVLQVNYRGSGGFGEAFKKAGYRQWGGKMIDDITDGVRALTSGGVADEARICIYGGSYGGYAALMSAVREPQLYKCAIGYAGVYDLPLLISDSDVSESKVGLRFWRDSIGEDKELLKEQSPISHIDNLQAAVMIVHGENDWRAPFTQAKALRAALDKRKIPYEWLVKYDEGHGFYDLDHRTELFEKMAAFIDRNIGATGPKK